MYLPFIITRAIIDNVKEPCGDSQKGARKTDYYYYYATGSCTLKVQQFVHLSWQKELAPNPVIA